MSLYEWHYARLKSDINRYSCYVPEGTIVRAKALKTFSKGSYLTFIEYPDCALDTFCEPYESLLEPLEK